MTVRLGQGGAVVATGRGRRTLALLCAVLLAPAVAGCDAGGTAVDPPGPSPSGAGSDPPAQPSPSATAPEEEPVELTFGVYGDEGVVGTYRRVADAYTGLAPHVSIDLIRFDNATSAATAVLAAGADGRSPDVFLLDQLQLPRLVAAEALQPLDEALDERGLQFGDDYQRSALTTFSADAQLQCMPVEMSPLVVYYNRRLVPRQALEDRGYDVPRGADGWTWETFEAAARAAAERDLLGPIKGTWLPPRMDLVTAMVRSGGDDVVDDPLDPQTLTLSSDGAVETLSQMATLAADQAISLTAEEVARRSAVDRFAAGDLGLLIGSRADLPLLRAARGLDFDVVSLPSFGRSTSVSRATGLCVGSDSDAASTAIDFVAFAAGPRAGRIVAATGELVPARLDVLTSDAFTQPGQLPRRSQAFVDGAKRSEPLPYSTRWPALATSAEALVQDLFGPTAGDLGPRALTRRLTRLDEASRSVLGQASAD